MKIKYAITVFTMTIVLAATPALALKPSKTPAAKIVMSDATALLEKRDYDGLEEMLGQYLKNRDRVDDGQWKLHLAMDGIDGNAAQFAGDAASVEKRFLLISDWVAAKPDSMMAKTALANAWIARAWLYRGMKASSETSQQQFDSFEKNLEKAFQELKSIGNTNDTNPELYMAWLAFALGAGLPSEVTDAIHKKAILQYPDYFYITLQHLITKFERWSGDTTALQDAIKPLAENPELFARAMWHLVVYYEKNNFTDAYYSNAAKTGFSLIKEKYNSPITMNQIGYFACFHWHDLALLETAISAIGNNPDLTVWGEVNDYNSCVNWAEGNKAVTKK